MVDDYELFTCCFSAASLAARGSRGGAGPGLPASDLTRGKLADDSALSPMSSDILATMSPTAWDPSPAKNIKFTLLLTK